MELVAVLCSINVHMVMVWSLTVDLPACRNCSNRSDVPCRIQFLDQACRHNEFNVDTWPGQPKALNGREVRGNGVSIANFTWKVPYDASYRALDGFLLSITMIEHSVPVSVCFFANLSGTVWKNVVNPYAVLFHFDCVKSQNQLDVELNLKSSPVPLHTSDKISVKSRISFQDHSRNNRNNRGRRQASFLGAIYNGIRKPDPDHSRNNRNNRGRRQASFLGAIYNGIRKPDPEVKPEPPKNISIDVEVKDLTVYVTFGPADDNLEHTVCLIKFDPSVSYPAFLCSMKQTVPKGENIAVFKNVSVDQYKVVVQIDDFLFKSKAFNVTAKKSAEESLSHLTILSITMACLVVVTGTTTLYFCILRKRGHCLSMDLTMCNCNSIYQKATYVPNNVAGDEEDVEILPLFYPESEFFKQAVQNCCMYLSKWSKCKINFDWMNENDPAILTETYQNRPCIALIFLSSKMLAFLDEMILKPSIVQQNFFPNNTFHNIYGNASKKIFVGLQPISDSSLYLKDKLELTKHVTHLNQLEINTENVNELISLLKVDTSMESGWCSHDELFSLLNAIRLVPPNELNMSGNHSQREKDMLKTSPTTGCCRSEVQNERVPCCGFYEENERMHVPLSQKEFETLKWAQSVPYSTLSCPNNCVISHGQNSTNFIIGHQLGEHGGHFNPDEVGPDESVSVYLESTLEAGGQGHCRPSDVLATMKWEPPDWDSESDSFSIIGQRQREIYNDYKASFGDTKL